jgi:hypothetical protein
MYKVIKKSVSESGKFWLTLQSTEGGWVINRLAQCTEEMFKTLTEGAEIAVPKAALRNIGD